MSLPSVLHFGAFTLVLGFEVLFEAIRFFHQPLGRNNLVAVEDGAGFVPRDIHGFLFSKAGVDYLLERRATQVMEEKIRELGRFPCRVASGFDVGDRSVSEADNGIARIATENGFCDPHRDGFVKALRTYICRV